MLDRERRSTGTSRRQFLSVAAVTAVGTVSGCLTENDTAATSPAGTITSDDPGNATGDGSTLATPTRGDPDADVRVLVFEDFACPHCRDFSLSVAPEIASEYVDTEQISYEFYDFPLPVDEEVSWEAACAARAVQASDGSETFFSYAKALFENQSRLGPEVYEEVATQQGLDGATIRESAVNREYVGTVRADRQAARDLGFDSTPTVLVGDRIVRPSYDAISAAIEAQL